MLQPDAMRDLLEGADLLESGMIAESLIQKKYITLSEFNKKNSKYGLHDFANKPTEISQTYSKGIKMISHIWCLKIFASIYW